MTKTETVEKGKIFTDPALVELDHVQHQFVVDDADLLAQTNPFRAGLHIDRVPSPCLMVIFGVSGDLTSRKLMPALYDLAISHPLPEGFTIVGVSHRDWSDDEFRDQMKTAIQQWARTPLTDEGWASFAASLHYVKGDFRDPAAYERLK